MRAGACAGSLIPRICRCPRREREGPGTGVQVRKVPVRAAPSAGLPLPLWSELTPPHPAHRSYEKAGRTRSWWPQATCSLHAVEGAWVV